MDRQLGADTYEVLLKFEGTNLERLVWVAGDLEFLRSLPVDRLPTHTEVRIAASVLRRLLIDDPPQLTVLLLQATKPQKPPPLTVEAVDIDTALNSWPERWVRYAFAGGASFDGLAHHTGMLLGVIPKAEHEPYGSMEAFYAANPLPMKGAPTILKLARFLDATSVAVQTNELGLVRISRRVVLQYIANRKGGVHFNPNRDLALPNGKRRFKERAYYLLDHGLLRVGHLSGPEYEVVSMAQAIANADWAEDLVQAAATAAPDDFDGDPSELKFWAFERQADGTGWATSRLEPSQASGFQAAPPP